MGSPRGYAPCSLFGLVDEQRERVVAELTDFEALPLVLRARGYRVLGPAVRDGAIHLDELETFADLPRGWTAEIGAGSYRLRRRSDDALFGYVVGPTSPKNWLHPADVLQFRAERSADGMTVRRGAPDSRPLAFVGVRSCDAAAIAVQDRVLRDGAVGDRDYEARRRGSFVVVANCTEAASTCFCVSTGTGPFADRGFDLAVTEQIDERGHRFLLEAGSASGREVLAELRTRPARSEEEEAAVEARERVAAGMERSIDHAGARDLLARNAESPMWQQVAERCLGCANCTMVCPTCFCTTVEDVTDLTGDHAERWRRWDSCFTFQFSYLASGVVRTSTTARYRHWLTHKLSSWHDQFGESGCTGCGRCIAWCPVGIDLTEVLAGLRDHERRVGTVEGAA